jgi:putative SOS response-associated peptidase YedK
MCNLYSMTRNVDAIRRLFGVDAGRDRAGNLPLMPGIFPDYPAPIVRNGDGGREFVMARWGMPSSQKALMDVARKRAEKLEAKGNAVVSQIIGEFIAPKGHQPELRGRATNVSIEQASLQNHP